MKITVDFDGTCVKNEFPKIGGDIGAIPVLQKLVKDGHKLILFTMRSGDYLKDAVKWFKDNSIELYGVNKDPDQKAWTTSPKAYSHVQIDDLAIGTPLIYPKKGKPYVNWDSVDKLLRARATKTDEGFKKYLEVCNLKQSDFNWGKKLFTTEDVLRRKLVEELEKPLRVKVEKTTRTMEKWMCPHCNEEIREKGIFYKQETKQVFHRDCKKEIILPLEKDSNLEHFKNHLDKDEGKMKTKATNILDSLGINFEDIVDSIIPDSVKKRYRKEFKPENITTTKNPFKVKPMFPTLKQINAGNYKKIHTKYHKMPISIENKRGSIRRDKETGGKKWQNVMMNSYGDIQGTLGADDDPVDVFINDETIDITQPHNDHECPVYVINQVNKDRSFDEHKCMLGFHDWEKAKTAYLSNYQEGWTGLGSYKEMTIKEFKKWVKDRNKTMSIAEQLIRSFGVTGSKTTEKMSQGDKSKELVMKNKGRMGKSALHFNGMEMPNSVVLDVGPSGVTYAVREGGGVSITHNPTGKKAVMIMIPKSQYLKKVM